MTKVSVTFKKQEVMTRIKTTADKGTAEVANELLKDANYYARQDSSELIKSSIKASQPEKGKLVWNTPYAKRMYYTGTPAKDKNPNASLMWAHKAAAQFKAKYIRMLQAIVKREV